MSVIKYLLNISRILLELDKLRLLTKYSSKDPNNMNKFLRKIAPELQMYTYTLLTNGVTSKDKLKDISEDELFQFGILKAVHRRLILKYKRKSGGGPTDVFISYRRSNGSVLASLINVSLCLRGYSVFIDVNRLSSGKFDENLLINIRKARNFLLILSANALDRCVGDNENQDWLHRVSM